MVQKVLAVVSGLLIFVAIATGCSGHVEAEVSPTLTAVQDDGFAPERAMPSPSATPAFLSDDELTSLQLGKFAYMQDPSRIAQFEESGYQTAKVKVAQDVLGGVYGPPIIEASTSFDEPIWIVNTGSYADPATVYTWFIIHLDDDGNPDYSRVFNLNIQVPGYPYVSILDTVHDWPTQIAGQSVNLLYSASYGTNVLDLVSDTCIWPALDQERQFCQGRPEFTKSADDMMQLDETALRLMDESMQALYGPNWKGQEA